MKRLLVGCCGSYSFSVTSEAAELIAALLQSSPSSAADLEAVIASALRQDCFLLGEQSRRVAIVVLSRCAQNQLNASDVRLFMEDLWRLYQVDDKDALPCSDVVECKSPAAHRCYLLAVCQRQTSSSGIRKF